MSKDFKEQLLESRKRMDVVYDEYTKNHIKIVAMTFISLLIILSYFVINYNDIMPTKIVNNVSVKNM